MKVTHSRMRVCTSKEMRQIDDLAHAQYQIDAAILMENAGRAAADVLFECYPNAGDETEILIFAGKGNNAGDAFVLARRLICLERRVRVFCLAPPQALTGAAKRNFEILKQMNARVFQVENAADIESFFRSSIGPFTVVDGMVGTGLKGNLDGIYYDVVETINKQKCNEVLALDIPTGVNADNGEVHGTSILANTTVSFGFPKLGHFLPPGAGRRGELINVDISLPPKFRKEGDKFLLGRSQMALLVKDRDRYGHKNSFGHTLLIGGSLGRLGAICMASKASHKMGTGLVTVATWTDALSSLMMKLPDETMAVAMNLEDTNRSFYEKALAQYSSVVVGPGLGMRSEGKFLIESLLEMYRGPLVLDADALNLISDHQLHEQLIRRRAPTVLTPHPGEMSRLLGASKESVIQDPLSALKRCVELTHAVVVLKGAATLIGSPDDVIYLNHYPNDGMATAGTGDVLAGMIGGLVGQSMSVTEATQLGVYLHSMAGKFAAKQLGHRAMTAPDIIENIGNAFKELDKSSHPSFPEEGKVRLY